MPYHVPVLLKESIDGLHVKPHGTYVDLTFGGGGHSLEILKKLETGKLFGFDQDSDAKRNIIDNQNFIFVNGNFKYFKNFLKYHKIEKVDGILADLGLSSHHIDEPKRGFSFRFDAKLDMRMNSEAKLTAFDVINTYQDEDLYRIFKEYGELKSVYTLVNSILSARKEREIETTFQLIEVIENSAPKHKEHRFYAQVFQAIRIEVNQEIDVLKKMLLQTKDILKPGGRLVVISYHSLEDRLVKNYMKSGNFEGKQEKDNFGNITRYFKLINKKIIIPTDEENKVNTRARSAKLRIAEKIRNEEWSGLNEIKRK